MLAFRDAHAARDAKTKVDMRNEHGERVIAGRRASGRAPISEAALRKEVARDLESLMNTVAFESTEDIAEFGNVQRSILNYGLPDIAHMTIDEARVDSLSAQIRAAQKQQQTAMKALDRQYPIPRASFEDFMQHVTHALDLVGPDHVGVGPDWDGGGGVTGMPDVASLPKVTERLVKLGYTEAQLGQFWGGNVLRVLGAVQAARKP